MAQNEDETVFLSEQRRFRRLEVSLPVWIGRESDLKAPASADRSPWSLGYTRDVSMGGTKVIVPPGEERKWLSVVQDGALCLLRFDNPDRADGEVDEYIPARVRHAAHDKAAGHFWLGVQYDEGAHSAKAAAMKSGLASANRRKRWQGSFVLALAAIGGLSFLINQQKASVSAAQLKAKHEVALRTQLNKQLSSLLRFNPVGSRAEGAALALQERDLKAKLGTMTAFSKPENQGQGEEARKQKLAQDGLELSSAPTEGQNVDLGVALPYGYAWPIVVSDLEDALGRRVPTIVIFRDFKSPFPTEDAREARLRAKTLQVTWEPWLYSNPKAVSLSDVAAGKYDKYLDSWALAAKSFGAEVWIRWAHEFNGNWYPWAIGNNNKDAQIYIRAFRRAHDRFTRAGAFNVRWIWCVNSESVPDAPWNDPAKAYPGDAYVDMVSIDGYNFGSATPGSRWQSFREIYERPYAELSRRFPNKPIMIGEIGCASVGGDKVAWIRDMDRQLRGNFKRFQGVVWFEAAKEADWRMMSSPEVLAASRAVFLRQHYRRGES